eukprot:3002316-Amphidinium_carterae.1
MREQCTPPPADSGHELEHAPPVEQPHAAPIDLGCSHVGTKTCTTTAARKVPQNKNIEELKCHKTPTQKTCFEVLFLIFVRVVLEFWGGGGGTMFGPYHTRLVADGV